MRVSMLRLLPNFFFFPGKTGHAICPCVFWVRSPRRKVNLEQQMRPCASFQILPKTRRMCLKQGDTLGTKSNGVLT